MTENEKEKSVDYDLTLKDFEMEEGARRTLTDKMSHLLDVSPSDAAASSSITKTGTGYLGDLRVVSQQGKFVAATAAHSLDELFSSMFQLIHRQLKLWRRGRVMT